MWPATVCKQHMMLTGTLMLHDVSVSSQPRLNINQQPVMDDEL